MSVIDIGNSPEGIRKAGTPPYADGGTNQRFIAASSSEVTIFENNGTVINRFPFSSTKYGTLYLQPSNPGIPTYYYAYGPDGGLTCADDGSEDLFCQLDGLPSFNGVAPNTTDAQCGRNANGEEQCNSFCRVQTGSVACRSETLAGDSFDPFVVVFNGPAGQRLISYAPLGPASGLGVTNEGYVFHIDTQSDVATELSSTAGIDVRSVACEQLGSGFGCVVQSFSDMQTTPCAGTNASDFSCGTPITTGDAITVGLGITDNGNIAVIASSFLNGSLHALEFTPELELVLQAEFPKSSYLSLFADVPVFDFLNPGHAEIDSINDTVVLSGNGSGNVIIIPIDDIGLSQIELEAGFKSWFQ